MIDFQCLINKIYVEFVSPGAVVVPFLVAAPETLPPPCTASVGLPWICGGSLHAPLLPELVSPGAVVAPFMAGMPEILPPPCTASVGLSRSCGGSLPG